MANTVSVDRSKKSMILVTDYDYVSKVKGASIEERQAAHKLRMELDALYEIQRGE